ncbi:hypothetical protein BV20DRAFT_1070526, partial [Pilatotrama ljubarskyi]
MVYNTAISTLECTYQGSETVKQALKGPEPENRTSSTKGQKLSIEQLPNDTQYVYRDLKPEIVPEDLVVFGGCLWAVPALGTGWVPIWVQQGDGFAPGPLLHNIGHIIYHWKAVFKQNLMVLLAFFGAEEARKAEADRKAAEEACKRAAEGSPEVEEVEGPKKKRAKKGKGKGKARADEDKDEEEESGQKKPVVLVASSKKAKCEMDGHPSNGPTLAPSQQAGGSGGNSGPDLPFNRRAWLANPSAAGRLTGEELLNTLLVEVQHLRRDHACTQEVLRDARADVRELRDSFYFLRLDRDHLRERQAALDAYFDRLGEEMSEAEAGDEEFVA